MSDPPESEIPPWDEPGATRRDCEPHRGGVLDFLGMIALICGSVSLCYGPLALVGFPLGIAVWVLARRDLKEMEAGRMDPDGEERTKNALSTGQVALLCTTVPILIWTYLLLGKYGNFFARWFLSPW